MRDFVRYVLIGIAVLALQWLVFGRLRLWGAYPDVVLLFLALVAVRFGRLPGMAAGFTCGLVMDAMYGTWGIEMFVKTLVGFVIGLFPVGERETLVLRPQQTFMATLMIALLHNGLLIIFYVLQAGTRNTFMITALWLGSAVYTATVAGVVALFKVGR